MATPGSFFDNTENYQPLRQGRSGNAICQGSLEPAKVRYESEEAKQRLKRGLETEDPLQAYVSYIRKLKDLYPSGSKLIVEALSEAADHFHDRPEYKNDPRLLNIFLQLADMQKDPRETFNFMQAHVVGNELPKFHMAMAAAFERAKDYKTAESCYSQAVSVAKGRPNAKEDFDLAMVHLTHFKRRMARLLQDSRALHGPGSPEASRATRAVGTVRAGARPTLRAQTSSQQQHSVRPQGLGVASTAKRPQFTVFDERSAGGQQQPVSSKRPAEAQWPTLETDASARENNDLAQPWTEAAPITQRTGATQARPPSFSVYQEAAPSTIPVQSFQPKGVIPQHPAPHRVATAAKPPSFTIWTEDSDQQPQQQPQQDPSSFARPPAPSAVKPPSFQVWTESEEKANEQEPPPAASSAKPPSFTVWTESKPTKQQSQQQDYVEETAQKFSNMRVSRGLEEGLQSAGAGAPNTVHSTPISEERAGDHTINTRRALDDMFEMFASPSMSVARGQPSAVRPMVTPAIWPAQQIAGAAAARGREEDDDDDEEQNTSPNIIRMPNMTRPTTVRRPPRSNRPALATIEHHEEHVSPSFRREIRNPPPKPVEKFSVARDTPGPNRGNRTAQVPSEDLTGDTFGISSVLAFGGNQQEASNNNPARNEYY